MSRPVTDEADSTFAAGQSHAPGSQELLSDAQSLHEVILSRCSPEELIQRLSLEERLHGLGSEERLRGIPAEERLRGLDDRERARLLELLLKPTGS